MFVSHSINIDFELGQISSLTFRGRIRVLRRSYIVIIIVIRSNVRFACRVRVGRFLALLIDSYISFVGCEE